jgi:hypothetical protein
MRLFRTHSFSSHLYSFRDKARRCARRHALSLFFFAVMFVITWLLIVISNWVFGAP